MKKLAFLLLFACPIWAQNWPSFRGDNASGIGSKEKIPANWNIENSTNILWKTSIPGLAHSSPIIWDQRIFVTTAIASDQNRELRIGGVSPTDMPDDMSMQSYRLYCVDLTTGEILWQVTAQEAVPRVYRHAKSTHASATPATDGKHVVALFASGGLYCYDIDGNPKWSQDLGVLNANWADRPDVQWGPASSPIIFKDFVIVQCDIEKDSFIAAFDLETGKKVWSKPRKTIPSWSTPTVFEGETRSELIISGSEDIRGYDVFTGRELWSLRPTSSISIPTPFAAHNLIYVASGYRRGIQPIYAIRPGSSGDISLKEGSDANKQIAWSTQKGAPYISTPVVYGSHLYVCGYNGVLSCYNANTGELIYQNRLGKGGFFSASPVAADGKIYAVNEEGDVFVVKAGSAFELLATNAMNEVCMATPAISRGKIVIRTLSKLVSIGIP